MLYRSAFGKLTAKMDMPQLVIMTGDINVETVSQIAREHPGYIWSICPEAFQSDTAIRKYVADISDEMLKAKFALFSYNNDLIKEVLTKRFFKYQAEVAVYRIFAETNGIVHFVCWPYGLYVDRTS